MKPILHEVGLRDGLQMEMQTVPLELKIEWAQKFIESGVEMLQLGSFVHPDKVPQMADTDSLFRHFNGPGRKPRNVTLSGLVLNEKGLERGLACGVDMFCMGVSASDTHSKKNTGMSTEEATERIIATAKLALTSGCRVQVSVQSAFGCGFEGEVPASRVLRIAEKYFNAGLNAVSLADTAGHALPEQVETLFSKIHQMNPHAECACHLHNTYGMGIVNCRAAMNSGVMIFESAIGGLGGCPFTKVAGGNVCTEDLVHYWRRAGIRSDIGLDILIQTARSIAGYFNRELPGMVYKSGPVGYAMNLY
ncbi:hydroxymethylglutaryl-CoA lyase [bacterium]|nr:hydroxymethylglutaryl-CoA lyase [bacterium]